MNWNFFLNIFFCLASSLGRPGWYMLKWPIFQLFMNGRVKIVLQIQKIMKWQKNRGNEKNNLFAQWQKNMMWFLDYCPHCTMNTFGGSKIGNLNHKKNAFYFVFMRHPKKAFFQNSINIFFYAKHNETGQNSVGSRATFFMVWVGFRSCGFGPGWARARVFWPQVSSGNLFWPIFADFWPIFRLK